MRGERSRGCRARERERERVRSRAAGKSRAELVQKAPASKVPTREQRTQFLTVRHDATRRKIWFDGGGVRSQRNLTVSHLLALCRCAPNLQAINLEEMTPDPKRASCSERNTKVCVGTYSYTPCARSEKRKIMRANPNSNSRKNWRRTGSLRLDGSPRHPAAKKACRHTSHE